MISNNVYVRVSNGSMTKLFVIDRSRLRFTNRNTNVKNVTLGCYNILLFPSSYRRVLSWEP